MGGSSIIAVIKVEGKEDPYLITRAHYKMRGEEERVVSADLNAGEITRQ